NSTAWDIGLTTNWSYLGNGLAFQQGSAVVLDDTALTNQLDLNVTATVFSMLVTNDTLNYSLNGNGGLTGTMALTKAGAGAFTLANIGVDSYTGGTVIQQGILDVRADNALGTGLITLAGGTLENNSANTATLTNAVYAQTNTTSILQGTGVS